MKRGNEVLVTGKPARRIEVSGKPQRRVEPEKVAAALGAEPIGEAHASNLDPVSFTALGSELIQRPRSSGGRPALADATEICRVPLSANDVKTLEEMASQIETSSGSKPSGGQLVSVIVRANLRGLSPAPNAQTASADGKPEAASSVSDVRLQQMIDEQVRPLREQVRRLEDELHSVGK